MFVLKKILQLRQKHSADQEKPFLEHLEDLRTMVFQIVVTLILAMGICFTFQDDLLALLRQPIDRTLHSQSEKKLPKGDSAPLAPSVEQWNKAVSMNHSAQMLNAREREAFLGLLTPEERFLADAAVYEKAALAFHGDEKKQQDFLSRCKLPADLHKEVTALLKSGANPETMLRGNLRMMSALSPTETFMLSMKLSMYAGIILSLPFLLYFISRFVLPGLHLHEKKVLWQALAMGTVLFLFGVLFSFLFVLPRALEFFNQWGEKLGVSQDWRIGEYVSFVTLFIFSFGLCFEVPVIVLVLVKLGLLSYRTMANTRLYAIAAIHIAAVIILPTPDIPTLYLMVTPMYLLYELCILLAWFNERKSLRKEAAERSFSLSSPTPPPEDHDDGWHETPYNPAEEGENQNRTHLLPLSDELPGAGDLPSPTHPLPGVPESPHANPESGERR